MSKTAVASFVALLSANLAVVAVGCGSSESVDEGFAEAGSVPRGDAARADVATDAVPPAFGNDDAMPLDASNEGGTVILPSPEAGTSVDGGDGGRSAFDCTGAELCTTAKDVAWVSGDLSFGVTSPSSHGGKTMTIVHSLTVQGSTSAFVKVYVSDDWWGTSGTMKVKGTLTSPVGENFDLYYYPGTDATACTKATQSSQNPEGSTDIAADSWDDPALSNDSRTVVFEVRAASGNLCRNGALWSLLIEGNQ